ncbi:DHS-like NAD/FAD-binding domain-containing protein [Massariosphaeria phaeospora]|uniref:DHS-like NAD/FAD-binding domain-containing protein n=1 Tax=Massariosphaeria phaeospora TaxID=100035 RepID=A0A7C8M2V5_9PLEO|nr:DHS-like NAD/FAD-binding domain-containing protein [Massariosphaeria phaeospora]
MDAIDRTAKTSRKPTSSDKKLDALKAKQQKRKFRGTSTPDPSLNVSLEDFTSFTQHLQASRRIFALLGAGLSVASGLATFRGSDRLWRGHEPQDLSDAQVFFEDPVKVWWFFSQRMMGAQEAEPNAAHFALAKLASAKEGFFAVNQNIDGLCERVAFPQSHIAQVHGTLFSIKCSKYQAEKDKCDYESEVTYPVNEHLTLPQDIDISDAKVALPEVARSDLPHCPKCNNLLRPNVVFFGEATPLSLTERIYQFTLGGPIDLMLVIGTSAVVLPAAMYIPIARNAGARVAFFNMEESDEEPGRLQDGDWFFKGDASETVADMLKGVIGNVGR